MIPWWVVAMQGGAAALLGALLLSAAAGGPALLAGGLGLYWLVTGILALVRAFMDHGVWGIKMLTAALGVLAGIWVVASPLWMAVGFSGHAIWAVGLLGVGTGVTQLAEAFYEYSQALGALGVLSVLLGVLVAFGPLGPGAALPLVASATAIGTGGFAMMCGFSER